MMTSKHDNLLLLHGALGSEEQFQELKKLLSVNFNVFTMNFEGHGGRPSENPFSMDLFARNVKDFMSSEGIEKTHIFGYSMGGYVALTCALEYPLLVDTIITLGTKFNWTPETAKKEVALLNPEMIQQKVPAFANRLEQLHAPNNWTEVVLKTAALLYDLGNGRALSDEELKNLSQDIHVYLGELDNMVSPEESEYVANLLPNGSFRSVPGTKHPIEQVNTEQLHMLIGQLLNSQATSTDLKS